MNWSVAGRLIYDVQHQSRVGQALGLAYDDECLNFSTTYSETHSRFTDEVSGTDGSPVRERDLLPLVQLSPQRPFGDTQLPGSLGMKPAQSGMFDQAITDRVCPMVSLEDRDVVVIAGQPVAWLQLLNFDWELVALDSQGYGRTQHALSPPGAVQQHGCSAILQTHGPKETGHPEQMVGMVVGKEDVAKAETHTIPHHLPLIAFTAVEENRFALAVDREPGNIAIDGRNGCGSAEEGDRQHVHKIRRERELQKT
jgi:hypothetical protein